MVYCTCRDNFVACKCYEYHLIIELLSISVFSIAEFIDFDTDGHDYNNMLVLAVIAIDSG